MSKKRTDVERVDAKFAGPDEYVGRVGVWTMEPRGQKPVTWLVKITEARKRWERMDLEVETNTGDRFWVSNKTVKVIRNEH